MPTKKVIGVCHCGKPGDVEYTSIHMVDRGPSQRGEHGRKIDLHVMSCSPSCFNVFSKDGNAAESIAENRAVLSSTQQRKGGYVVPVSDVSQSYSFY
jgi:hypothetical protein